MASSVVEDVAVTANEANYDAWDPLLAMSRHFLNSVDFDSNDPLAGIYASAERLRIQDTPCKFYDPMSSSKTCNRKGCQYLHGTLPLSTPLVQREIILSNQLMKKTKAKVGIMNIGVVVSASDPGDFYIVPYSDWKCACKLNFIGEEKKEVFRLGTRPSIYDGSSNSYYDTSVKNTGVANLLRLFEDLRLFERAEILEQKLTSVSTNQLVVARLKSDNGNERKWYRAIALEDVILGEDGDTEIPEASVLLLDYGTIICVKLQDLALLPSKLLRYPPLGYRCALNGINPVSHRWSATARKFFTDQVLGKECLFELTRRSPTPNRVFEEIPHLVDLSIEKQGTWVNLSEKLASEGLGVQWNPFPSQSHILKDASNPRASLFLSRDPSLISNVDSRMSITETDPSKKKILLEYLQRDLVAGGGDIPFPSKHQPASACPTKSFQGDTAQNRKQKTKWRKLDLK